MACAAPEERPRLPANEVRRDERRTARVRKESLGFLMVTVAPVADGDPERSVDEDHR
jgi:hypothetical protein